MTVTPAAILAAKSAAQAAGSRTWAAQAPCPVKAAEPQPEAPQRSKEYIAK